MQFENGNTDATINELFYEGHERHFCRGRKHFTSLREPTQPVKRLTDNDISFITNLNREGVYVLVTESEAYAKIGRTTNLQERLRSLSTASPERLYAHRYYVCEQSHRLESIFHGIFSDYRTNGEWFRGVILQELQKMQVDEFGAFEYHPSLPNQDGIGGVFAGDKYLELEINPRVPSEVRVGIEAAASRYRVTVSAFTRAILEQWTKTPGAVRGAHDYRTSDHVLMHVMMSDAQKRVFDIVRKERELTLGQCVTSAYHLYLDAEKLKAVKH